MAAWCFATGQSAATWRELTRCERAAFTDEARRIATEIKRMNRR